MFLSEASLTEEEMLKLCFFVCHTMLSSLSALVSYNVLFFFFQIEAYVVVSICQSSSMYSVEAQDPHSLKRNKSQVCTFPSPLWLFPTVTYAIVSTSVSLTDFCVLVVLFFVCCFFLSSTNILVFYFSVRNPFPFFYLRRTGRFTGVYKCNSPTQFLPSFQCRPTPILHLAGLI